MPQDKILAKTVLKLIPSFITPNHISIFRITATPFVAYIIVNIESAITAFLIFLIVVSTDLIDGALARTTNQITEFGKFIDPIADKLLIITSAILLLPSLGLTQLLILMVSIEIGVLVLRKVLEKKGIEKSANLSGKIKMVLQSVGILMLLFISKDENFEQFARFAVLILYLSVLANLGSFILFLFDNYRSKPTSKLSEPAR